MNIDKCNQGNQIFIQKQLSSSFTIVHFIEIERREVMGEVASR